MKRIWTALILLGLAGVIAWWVVMAQSQSITVPFATTPLVTAYIPTGPSAKTVVFLRKIDGSYIQASFGPFSPFQLLSDVAAINDLKSAGVNNLVAAPTGPPGIGRASQRIAGGKFRSDGTGGIAYLLFSNRTSVFVRVGTSWHTSIATYPVGPTPAGVIAADFDGDGVLDLAVSYAGTSGGSPGGIAILINKGDGTFQPAVSYAAGTSPSRFTAFDLNHDNILDLAVADSGSSSLYVLLGKGDGTFNSAVAYPAFPAGSFGLSVTAADLNGDGVPDLAATSGQQNGAVTILLGNGNGTFRNGSSYPVGNLPTYIAAGDFNGDGKLDLAASSNSDSTVTIFVGNGNGTFQRMSTYVVSATPSSLVLTDYNRDGKLDIISGGGDARAFGRSAEQENVDFLLGNGDGTFQGLVLSKADTSSVTFVAAADFNNDGKIDAIVNGLFGNNLYYFAGSGGSQFASNATTIPLGSSQSGQLIPSDAAVGDFNGDGKPDVAITEGYEFGGPSMVAILLNNGSGFQAPSTFASGGSGPTGIAAADLDGDGKLDLAVTNISSGTTAVFRGAGNGTFQLLQTYPTGSHPAKVAVADVNGDGKPDLLIADNGSPSATPPVAGAVYVLRNTGNGSFQTAASFAVSRSPIRVAAGDFNGDGKQDIVTIASGPNVTFFLGISLGNGDGTFRPATILPTDFGPSDVAVRDFNRDGKADIVVAHCCGATDMTYFQGNGDGTFSAEVHFNGPPSPVTMSVTDVNLDGLPDLIIAGTDGAIAAVLDNASGSTNKNSASYSTGALAPDMIAFGEASSIAAALTVAGSNPWPTTLGGVHLDITDSQGQTRPAPIYFVTTNQMGFLIPAATSLGRATVTLTNFTGAAISSSLDIDRISPGLYTANSNGSGAPAGFWVRADANNVQTQDYLFDATKPVGSRDPVPVDLGPATDQVFLSLYGTGFRGASSVSATVGGVSVPIYGFASVALYQGEDQINIGPLPRSLAGRGRVDVVVVFDGKFANTVTVSIR